MRRRRTASHMAMDNVSLATQQALNDIESAQTLCKDLVIPKAFEVPSNLDGFSEAQLEGLVKDLEQYENSTELALEKWNQFSEYAQRILNASLSLSSIKGDIELRKRRRNGGQSTSDIQLGSSVAYKLVNKKPPDDEWIACCVTKVIQDGAQYEVKDPVPDETTDEEPVYKALYKELILLPKTHTNLPVFPPNSSVIAQYPDTTTFYRANVVSTRGSKCKLKFCGEEEETEVDRLFVLKPAN